MAEEWMFKRINDEGGEGDESLEAIEHRLRLTMAKFRLAAMEQILRATERGDIEATSRWTNLLNTVRNLVGRVDS